MLSNGKTKSKPKVVIEPIREVKEESNRTVSLINEIESKLNKKKKKK